jgi:SAM-dependent methyltransferase
MRFMGDQNIGLQDWFQTPPGRYLLDWERVQFDRAVADIFGYHALQLGLVPLDALKANRMPHRWLAASRHSIGHRLITPPVALVTDFAALPFPANSLDLVALPHTLELHADPHATLREVERVLVPEGRVVICGFNPASLWGLRQQRARLYRRLGWGELFLPGSGEFIGLVGSAQFRGRGGAIRGLPAGRVEREIASVVRLDGSRRFPLVADFWGGLLYRRGEKSAWHEAHRAGLESGTRACNCSRFNS